MIPHNFIFSNRRRDVVARHISFWLLWWVFHVFTYYLPHFWFVDWQFDQAQVALTEQMGYLRFSQFVVVNTFVGLIATHLFFTYPVLYYLMPRFLYAGRYLAFLIGASILLILTVVFTYYKFRLTYYGLLNIFDIPIPNYSNEFIIYCMWTQVLFNCPTVAALAAGIKFFKHFYQKEIETQQMEKEKVRAELQLLKAQVHPHFLFNTLNSIYFFTLTSSAKAPELVKKLSALLHYMLNECNRPFVPLSKELAVIQDYVDLEKARYEHLNFKMSVSGRVTNERIAPLILIPFVENCFKHGTSKVLQPWITLHIEIVDQVLSFTLGNSKPDGTNGHTNGGIGLSNVIRRLELLYPQAHNLEVSEDLSSYRIALKLKLHHETFAEREPELTPELSYDWA